MFAQLFRPILFCTLMLVRLSCNQAGAQESWARTFARDTSTIDWSPVSLARTSDGGFILSTSDSYGRATCYKLTSAGGITWSWSYGGGDSERIHSIQQTTDGGYIMVGEASSFGKGDYDAWYVKLNSIGKIVWQKRDGVSTNETDEHATCVRQTTDGGYIIVGYSDAPGYIVYAWCLKLDSAGSVQWKKTYSGTSDDYARAVRQTRDGGYIIAGSTWSFGSGYLDAWCLKLDSAGNVLWQNAYGGTGADNGYAIEETSDGGFIIVGSYGANYLDAWFAKLNVAGKIVWQKAFGGGDEDVALDVKQTSDKGYVICGYTDSYGFGGRDAWCLKLTSSGKTKWLKNYGGKDYDDASAVIQMPDGGYALAGVANSFDPPFQYPFLLRLPASGSVCVSGNTIFSTVKPGKAVTVPSSNPGTDLTATISSTKAKTLKVKAPTGDWCSGDRGSLFAPEE